MMKTATKKTVLQELGYDSHLEESFFDQPKPETIAELQENGDNEIGEESLNLGQIIQNSDLLLGIITDQVKCKHIWQIVAACFMMFIIIISFICFGLYMDHKNHLEKLSQSEVNIQRVSNDFTKADQKLQILENQLTKSKAELERAQGRLSNSSSEVKNLQNQLADTRQRLKALQNRNSEAVKRLNERLRKLSAQPIEND